MALGLPTFTTFPADISEFFGGSRLPERDETYRVESERVRSHMAIRVTNDFYDTRWRKDISLKWHWYQTTSPAERIRRATEKAQKLAEQINYEELGYQHEADIATR